MHFGEQSLARIFRLIHPVDRNTEREIDDRLLSWTSNLSEKAETQARATAMMSFISPRLALMPDTHLGLLAGYRSQNLHS